MDVPVITRFFSGYPVSAMHSQVQIIISHAKCTHVTIFIDGISAIKSITIVTGNQNTLIETILFLTVNA